MRKNPVLVAMGKRIRELRKERGYSQEGFSNELGLDRSYYGGVERGERNIAALNLVLIAKRLKVEVGDLFPPAHQLSAPKPKSRSNA